MADARDREFLVSVFLMEAWDTVAAVEDLLARGSAAREDLVVVTHRLKGAAALNGFPGIAALAGAMEELAERDLDGEPDARRRAGARMEALVEALKRALDGVGAAGREDAGEIAEVLGRPAADGGAAAPAGDPGAPAAVPDRDVPAAVAELDAFYAAHGDVLAYFGPEVAEHLETMTHSLLALERSGPSDDEVHRLFRAVHTLKGAAYTVGCRVVGDLAH